MYVIISRFSFQKAFIGVVKETDDLAGQHELISESLMEKIWKDLHLLHTELKTDRRKVHVCFICTAKLSKVFDNSPGSNNTERHCTLSYKHQ